MKIRDAKGFKPKLLKQMAMLMSICYLMSSLQHPIIEGLHGLLHSLEMPSSILSHNTEEHLFESAHVHSARTNYDDIHEHALITIVDTVLEASNEDQNQDQPYVKKNKLKKHISSEALLLVSASETIILKQYFGYKANLPDGYLTALKIPPRA